MEMKTNTDGAVAIGPNQQEIDLKTPVIVLDGKAWPIPKLAPRQNRIIVPAFMKVGPKIAAMIAGVTDDPVAMTKALAGMDTPTYDLMLDIVYVALTRAHPQLPREAFDDMALDTTELTAALNVVAMQSGFFTKKEVKPGEVKAGTENP